MGQIINTKNMPDKSVVCKILLNEDEVANLRGHLKNIHIFSSEHCIHESQVNTRGNKGVTKYFKIPLSIRSRKKNTGVLKYQKLNTPTKVFYIYTLNTKENESEKEYEQIESSLNEQDREIKEENLSKTPKKTEKE